MFHFHIKPIILVAFIREEMLLLLSAQNPGHPKKTSQINRTNETFPKPMLVSSDFVLFGCRISHSNKHATEGHDEEIDGAYQCSVRDTALLGAVT